MRDVSVVLLSVGEPYTERALESVHNQSLAPREIIRVEHVRPFHAALNAGAARVQTEFFLQVDADMVLDPDCLAELRERMHDRVGIVMGRLRDALVGRTAGIKLFRRACFDRHAMPDSISPDTDFVSRIGRQGWLMLESVKYEQPPGSLRDHCFGEHAPHYEAPYTFRKFLVLGMRHHYRRHGAALHNLFYRLDRIGHPLADVATLAAGHGVFLDADRDLLGRQAFDHIWPRLEALLAGADGEPLPDLAEPQADTPLARLFDDAVALGADLRRCGRAAAALALLRDWRARRDVRSWIRLVGLCHGVCDEESGDSASAFGRLQLLLDDWAASRRRQPHRSAAVARR